jgi:hypothetical protein
MEQQATGGPSDLGHLRERLARLERDHYHEVRYLRDKIETHELRLAAMEHYGAIRLPSGSAGIKLLLVVLIPIATYLLTGSLESAVTAAGVAAG